MNNHFGIKDYKNMFNKYGIKLPVYYFFENHLFDILNKIDTHKRLLKSEYSSKPINFNEGVYYMASFNSVIKKTVSIIHALESEEFDNYNLIDIGSGKGKVLFIWNKYLNKHKLQNKIIGIEYDLELSEIASRNLKNKNNIQLLNLDIENTPDYIFEEDAVYYLYNPFGEKIIKFFLDKINSKHFIIYNNPVHLNTFLDNNYEIVKNNYDFHPNLDWVILRKKNLI
jgi:hypothetical protein